MENINNLTRLTRQININKGIIDFLESQARQIKYDFEVEANPKARKILFNKHRRLMGIYLAFSFSNDMLKEYFQAELRRVEHD